MGIRRGGVAPIRARHKQADRTIVPIRSGQMDAADNVYTQPHLHPAGLASHETS